MAILNNVGDFVTIVNQGLEYDLNINGANYKVYKGTVVADKRKTFSVDDIVEVIPNTLTRVYLLGSNVTNLDRFQALIETGNTNFVVNLTLTNVLDDIISNVGIGRDGLLSEPMCFALKGSRVVLVPLSKTTSLDKKELSELKVGYPYLHNKHKCVYLGKDDMDCHMFLRDEPYHNANYKYFKTASMVGEKSKIIFEGMEMTRTTDDSQTEYIGKYSSFDLLVHQSRIGYPSTSYMFTVSARHSVYGSLYIKRYITPNNIYELNTNEYPVLSSDDIAFISIFSKKMEQRKYLQLTSLKNGDVEIKVADTDAIKK